MSGKELVKASNAVESIGHIDAGDVELEKERRATVGVGAAVGERLDSEDAGAMIGEAVGIGGEVEAIALVGDKERYTAVMPKLLDGDQLVGVRFIAMDDSIGDGIEDSDRDSGEIVVYIILHADVGEPSLDGGKRLRGRGTRKDIGHKER